MAEQKENQILLINKTGCVVDIPQWRAKTGTIQDIPNCVRETHISQEDKDKVNRIFLALKAHIQEPDFQTILNQFKSAHSTLPLQFKLPKVLSDNISAMSFETAMRYNAQLCEREDIEVAQNWVKVGLETVSKVEVAYEALHNALIALPPFDLTIFTPYKFTHIRQVSNFLKPIYSNADEMDKWREIFKREPNYIIGCKPLAVGYFTQESLSAIYCVPELANVAAADMLVSYHETYRHLSFVGMVKKTKEYIFAHNYEDSFKAQLDAQKTKSLYHKTQKAIEFGLMLGHYKNGILESLSTPYKTKLKDSKKTMAMLTIMVEREKINFSLKDWQASPDKERVSTAKKFKI